MKLHIENLAKIDRADVELNGLTVIAGDNDTGKSTIGKTLYAMFNGFKNMSSTIHRQRCRSLSNAIINFVYSDNEISYTNSQMIDSYEQIVNFSDMLEKLRNLTFDGILVKLEEYLRDKRSFELLLEENRRVELKRKIDKILQIKDEEIARQRVGNIFNRVFKNQVNSLQSETVANIGMKIKEQTVYAKLKDNICGEVGIDFNLNHGAVYIDNPFVMDRLSSSFPDFDYSMMYGLERKLRKNKNVDLVTNIVNKKALSDVMQIIEDVVPGEFIRKDKQVVLSRSTWKEPLNVVNLSTGVKSFAVLKILIQNHQLQEKDVLILDEPEIHLHPEWQVRYAEFLVLIQKAFDLTILLTTHSPYFLNAIEVFSKKYDTQDKFNVYKTEVVDKGVILSEVSDEIEVVYASLAKPFEVMEKLENELGMME